MTRMPDLPIDDDHYSDQAVQNRKLLLVQVGTVRFAKAEILAHWDPTN